MRMRLRLVARLLGAKLFNAATNPKLIYSLIDSFYLLLRKFWGISLLERATICLSAQECYSLYARVMKLTQ